MTSLDDFRKALDMTPTDWDLRKVYGDFLEESGKLLDAAYQRWLAHSFLAPCKGVHYWYWNSPTSVNNLMSLSRNEKLPSIMLDTWFQVLRHGLTDSDLAFGKPCYSTRVEAEDHLQRRIWMPRFSPHRDQRKRRKGWVRKDARW